MARYTCIFTVEAAAPRFHQSLIDILKSCHLDIIYDTADYMMAREQTGQVSYSKLVTVEVLIDRVTTSGKEIRMNFVVKNEELPLQMENHCRQIFDQVSQAITDKTEWQLITSSTMT